MAKLKAVKIPADQLQKVIKIAVGKNDGSKLDKTVFYAMGKLTQTLVNGIPDGIEMAALKGMTEALQTVNASLKTGFEGAYTGNKEHGWERLTPAWIYRKQQASKDKFWRNTGALSRGFSQISSRYIKDLENKRVSVKARARKRTYGKATFTYEINIKIPAHPNDFFNRITRDSFLSGLAYSGYTGVSGRVDNAYAKIGVLEGEGDKTHRPFIAKLFAEKGRSFNGNTAKLIEWAVKKSGRLRMVS